MPAGRCPSTLIHACIGPVRARPDAAEPAPPARVAPADPFRCWRMPPTRSSSIWSNVRYASAGQRGHEQRHCSSCVSAYTTCWRCSPLRQGWRGGPVKVSASRCRRAQCHRETVPLGGAAQQIPGCAVRRTTRLAVSQQRLQFFAIRFRLVASARPCIRLPALSSARLLLTHASRLRQPASGPNQDAPNHRCPLALNQGASSWASHFEQAKGLVR